MQDKTYPTTFNSKQPSKKNNMYRSMTFYFNGSKDNLRKTNIKCNVFHQLLNSFTRRQTVEFRITMVQPLDIDAVHPIFKIQKFKSFPPIPTYLLQASEFTPNWLQTYC